MARKDTPKDKSEGFKKRAHRPWNTLLEKAIRGTEVVESPKATTVPMDNTHAHAPALSPSYTQNPSPVMGHLATERVSDDTQDLAVLDEPIIANTTVVKAPPIPLDSPLSIGGFAKPSAQPSLSNLETAYLDTTHHSQTRKTPGDHKLHFALLEQISQLELEKEDLQHNILGLKKQLQSHLNQVQELDRQRLLALEEKKMTETQLKSALEQFLSGESSRVQEIERQRQLVLSELLNTEERLKNIETTLNTSKEQLLLSENARIQIEAAEKLAQKQYEAEFAARVQIETNASHTQKKLDESTARLEALMMALDEANALKERMLDEKATLENKLHLAHEKNKETGYACTQLQQQRLQLEEENKRLESHLTEMRAELSKAHTHFETNEVQAIELKSEMTKIKEVIQTERKLRKLAEENARAAFDRVKEAELARQLEINIRKQAEEKAEKAMTETSKALMHILSNPENRDR